MRILDELHYVCRSKFEYRCSKIVISTAVSILTCVLARWPMSRPRAAGRKQVSVEVVGFLFISFRSSFKYIGSNSSVFFRYHAPSEVEAKKKFVNRKIDDRQCMQLQEKRKLWPKRSVFVRI